MEHLIPDAWFTDLPPLVLLVIGAVALFVLSKGADWLVEGASELAERVGIPKVVIGATVVSLGTTAPECAVSVMAAVNGNAGLALGNSVGSVIFDTAVIFGGGCLLTQLPADKFLLQRQGWVQFGSAVLLAVICYGQFAAYGADATVPQWIGIGLLVLLAVYLWISVRWSKQMMNMPDEQEMVEEIAAGVEDIAEGKHHETSSLGSQIGRIIGGLVCVLIGSRVTIVCVTLIARYYKIPEVVISATLIAFGTSLPELIVGLTAIRKGHPELLVGNVIGADILNILFVTGAAALAMPLPIVDTTSTAPYVFLQLHLPAMLLILGFFRICIAKSIKPGYFSRWMGIPLLLSYVVFVVLSLLAGADVGH